MIYTLPSPAQYIIYQLATSVVRPGRTEKIPLDWRTLRASSPLDPQNWLALDQARSVVSGLGGSYGVGFVFTSSDPYWVMDVDHALLDGVWSPLANWACSTFRGAYVEVSSSGQGLHIIGSGIVPPHSTRAPGLEFYDAGRFIALTFAQATGSADTDHSATLAAMVAQVFPATAGQTALAVRGWTTAPVPEWGGPDDDDALIAAASRAKSAGNAFGNRASFQQLWEGDTEALARAFPVVAGDDRAYDFSAADASLAQHLAFWTGKNCERMLSLMEQSALAREKWNDRPDYLRRTIVTAAGRCTKVAEPRKAVAVTGSRQGVTGSTGPRQGEPQPGGPALVGEVMGGLMTSSDLPRLFEGVIYIEDRYVAAVPDGTLLSPQQFRASGRYGGRRFMLDDNSKSTRNAWEAFTESEAWSPPFAHSLCFRPRVEPRAIIEDAGRKLYNNYVPVQTRRVEGDAGPFLRHLDLLFPRQVDRDIVLAFMAFCVQYPGFKAQFALLIQGCEGNGKTLLLRVMSYCIGERYSHIPNSQDLANKFNAWLEAKLFIGVEEIYVSDRRDSLDRLKEYVTNTRIEIQAKGANQYTADNYANIIAMTNHKDAIPKTENDRRWAVLFTGQQSAADLVRDGMDSRYFTTLWGWLGEDGYAIVNHYLRSYAIPYELNPAGGLHRAPDTSSTVEAIEVSRGPVEQLITEAIEAGEVGFRGGWVSSHYLGLLLDANRLRGRASPNAWDGILASLGYIKHPALPRGRATADVMPENKRSRLWVREGTIPALNLSVAAAAMSAYTAANQPGAGASAVPAPAAAFSRPGA